MDIETFLLKMAAKHPEIRRAMNRGTTLNARERETLSDRNLHRPHDPRTGHSIEDRYIVLMSEPDRSFESVVEALRDFFGPVGPKRLTADPPAPYRCKTRLPPYAKCRSL